MTALWPQSIVIVGGGTAGWLAALILRDAARRAGRPVRITVIESSKIGTIGVGEGSTAVFRQMLRHLGIDELAFLRETGATIKYGIRHRDWRRLGHHYDGPIDDPRLVTRGAPLDGYAVANGLPVAQAHLFQHLIDGKKAPFAQVDGRLVPAGPYHFAYHFDQALAGAFLRKQAQDVTVIDDQVVRVETGEAGITALGLEAGGEVRADLFLDCTGFRRALIGALGATWVGYGDVLPVNRAMPFWLDIPEGEEIDPVTLAWAQKSGWMWKIPTQDRYGCGYVYSDAHLSPDQAQAEIEQALGHPIEPRNDIKINAGRLDRPWIGNCVALGLSSSFLEPLEATSIHGTIVQLLMLSAWLGDPTAGARYNQAVAQQVDDFRDFIRLHYVSERRDTVFWQDVSGSLPAQLQDRLTDWAGRLPQPQDFAPFPLGLPHVQDQLFTPVLDGLGLLPPQSGRAVVGPQSATLAQTHAALVAEYRAGAQRCLPHRGFLQSLRHG